MPKIKLTKRTVEGLKAPHPSGKQVLYWDTELRGFGVLVSGLTNSKTYIAQRRLPNGRTRRVTIDATNKISLEQARDDAAIKLHDLHIGNDPKAERHAAARIPLRRVLEEYLKARNDLREKSKAGYSASIEQHLTKWLDLPLGEITPDMIEGRHREIQEEISARWTNPDKTEPKPGAILRTGNATANSTMRAFRILWNFAAEREDKPSLPANPVRRLRRQWFPVERRERIVRAEDLPRFYEAVCELPSRTHRDYVLLMLFTGLRRTEAASLRWDDVDLASRVLRISAKRTKAGRKLDLPMSDFVHGLLVARRSLGKDGDFVFPSNGKRGHVEEPKFPLGLVAKVTGITVSAHDLRRTFITVAEATDISPLALKALVNHSLGNDVTSGYVIVTTDRLREPVQRVCDRLKELCRIEPVTAENVRQLA